MAAPAGSSVLNEWPGLHATRARQQLTAMTALSKTCPLRRSVIRRLSIRMASSDTSPVAQSLPPRGRHDFRKCSTLAFTATTRMGRSPGRTCMLTLAMDQARTSLTPWRRTTGNRRFASSPRTAWPSKSNSGRGGAERGPQSRGLSLFLDVREVPGVSTLTLQGEDGSGDDGRAVGAAARSSAEDAPSSGVATPLSAGAHAAGRARLVVGRGLPRVTAEVDERGWTTDGPSSSPASRGTAPAGGAPAADDAGAVPGPGRSREAAAGAGQGRSSRVMCGDRARRKSGASKTSPAETTPNASVRPVRTRPTASATRGAVTA